MDVILDRIDAAYPFIHITVFIVGFAGNVALLIATIFGTPKTIKTYSIMIRCGTLSDLVCIFVDVFTMRRLLIVPGNILYLFGGPCSFISTRACYIAHCMENVTLVYSGYVMLANFAFRLWILHFPCPSPSSVRIAMFLTLLPPAAVGFAFTFADADLKYLEEFLRTNAPHYLNEPGALSGHTGLTPHLIFTIIYTITTPIPVYAGLIIMRHKILSKLRKHAASMSAQTRSMHKCVVKALTIHASLCPITIFGILIYIVMFFDIYSHPAMEKAIYAFAAFPPALTPFGFLYYVHPYRQFVFRVIRRVPITRKLTAPSTVVRICLKDMTTVSS